MSLCTMCMHGINRDEMWQCGCGERHCPHMWECKVCGTHRKQQPKTLQKFTEDLVCKWCGSKHPASELLVVAGAIILADTDPRWPRKQAMVLCRKCFRETQMKENQVFHSLHQN